MRIPDIAPSHLEVDGLTPWIGKNGFDLIWRGETRDGITWVYYKTPEMENYISWLAEVEVFEDTYERL